MHCFVSVLYVHCLVSVLRYTYVVLFQCYIIRTLSCSSVTLYVHCLVPVLHYTYIVLFRCYVVCTLSCFTLISCFKPCHGWDKSCFILTEDSCSVSPCEICGGQSDTGAVVSHLRLNTYYCYQKDKRWALDRSGLLLPRVLKCSRFPYISSCPVTWAAHCVWCRYRAPVCTCGWRRL